MPPRIVSVTVNPSGSVCIGIDGGPSGGPVGTIRINGGTRITVPVTAGTETDWQICYPLPPGGVLHVEVFAGGAWDRIIL